MKKMILLASAALAFGGVASAQDSSMQPTGTTTPDAASAPTGAPDMGAQPADQSGGQTTPGMPDSNGGMTTPGAGDAAGSGGDMSTPPGQNMAPSAGTAPTMGATPPGTATGPNGPVSLTPTQGPTDLPACSKTVTDNCKQLNNPTGGSRHHATRHRASKSN